MFALAHTVLALSPRIFRVWVGMNSGRDSGRFSGCFRALSGFAFVATLGLDMELWDLQGAYLNFKRPKSVWMKMFPYLRDSRLVPA